MEKVLLVNDVLQWLALASLLAFVLALTRLVGTLRSISHQSQHDQRSLKGVNISAEEVYNARSHQTVGFVDLLQDRSVIAILTDPTCKECEDRLEIARSMSDFPWDRTIIIVRGTREAAKQLVDEWRQPWGQPAHIVAEHHSLGLSSFKAPFGLLIDPRGFYVTAVDLGGEQELRSLIGTLYSDDERVAMLESATRTARDAAGI
jgi:hypothetical protein